MTRKPFGAWDEVKRRYLITAMFLLSIIIASGMATYTEAKNDGSFDRTITVDKNSDSADYKSIQRANEDAPSGSTIYVKTGTYSEIININKKINLIGENKGETVINPISRRNSYAIRISASGVKINGFGINNQGPGPYTTGIKISVSQTIIEDCDIFDTPVGIAIWSSENTISNCRFWGCKDEGIALLGTYSSTCNNNKIMNCEFYDNCDGIELQYSSDNIISNCNFYDNTHAGIDAIASSNNRNIISNCKIYDNAVHGIYLSRSSDNQIIGCSLSNNEDGNIIITAGSFNNEIKNQESQESINDSRRPIRSLIHLLSSFLQSSRLRLFF